MPEKIFLISAEASGDLQAAALIDRLKTRKSDLIFMGVGGPRMQKAGAQLIYDGTTLGSIGLIWALFKLPEILKKLQNLKKILRREKPDLLILIDSPALNMRMAKFARELKIPTIYYFPPSAWSQNPRRAEKIASLVSRVIPVFQHTAKIYREKELPAFYTGHPLLDIMEEHRAKSEPADPNLIGLLPGSRRQEIQSLLPVILKTARQLHREFPEISFLLPLASTAFYPLVSRQVKAAQLPIQIVSQDTLSALSRCRLLLTASGSVTLEAALLEIPMVVIYRLPPPEWYLLTKVVKLHWASLPNILLGKTVLPELLQDKAKPEYILPVMRELWQNSKSRENMQNQLKEVKKLLGKPGVLDRIAEFILDFMQNEQK